RRWLRCRPSRWLRCRPKGGLETAAAFPAPARHVATCRVSRGFRGPRYARAPQPAQQSTSTAAPRPTPLVVAAGFEARAPRGHLNQRVRAPRGHLNQRVLAPRGHLTAMVEVPPFAMVEVPPFAMV